MIDLRLLLVVAVIILCAFGVLASINHTVTQILDMLDDIRHKIATIMWNNNINE